MHRWLVVLLFFSTAMLSAQDWALLNPAYKYNYSNDGTDTISNQIFVTHIDTLGSDSLLYDLNLIGVVCDTCPASLGSSCDGCFVRVGLPQFMGYQCFRCGNDWYFLGGYDQDQEPCCCRFLVVIRRWFWNYGHSRFDMVSKRVQHPGHPSTNSG